MDLTIKIYVLGKITEYLRKRILQEEIINKAIAGIAKADNVLDDFWLKARKFIKEAQEVDNKYVPDFIEKTTEELILGTIDILEKEVNIKDLLEKIVKEEKTELYKTV